MDDLIFIDFNHRFRTSSKTITQNKHVSNILYLCYEKDRVMEGTLSK